MNNWFDHILFNARTQPETSAVLMEDRVVTYGMLGAAIESCAQRIAALDFAKDGLVAVCISNPIRHLTISLALFRIGVRSISLEPPHQPITANLNFVIALGDAEARPALASGRRFIEVTDIWFTTEPARNASLPAPFSGERQVFRQSLTSGTTGEPKIINNTIEYVGRHVVPGIGVFNCELVLSMPGLTTIWGFMVAAAVLASRKTLCFAASPFQAVRLIELFSIDFALSDIKNVNYSPYMSPPQVTLSVRRYTVFGETIAFCAPVSIFPLRSSAVINDLIDRVDAARQNS
jgi:acyl-coenzyme A synthetase/AMP-(fatty) acid ligase